MQPTILQKPEILLVGMSFYGDPFDASDPWSEENQIGRTCRRLEQYLEKHAENIRHRLAPGVTYEVHIYSDATLTQGLFEVFVGVPVAQFEAVPVELSAKMLPATEYALFTLQGEAIFSDWYMHVDQWLAAAGYERSHPYSMQCYDTRFKGLDKITESVLDAYMPIRIAKKP